MALAHHAGGLRAARVRHARAGRNPVVRSRPVASIISAREAPCYGVKPDVTRAVTVAAVVLVLAGVASAQDGPTGTADPWAEIADAAILGDALAQYLVAGAFFDEAGDIPESAAVFWYQQAADQGLAIAQAMLGAMYTGGFGAIAPDAAESARWYRLAADQGLEIAQWALSLMYARGDGVPEDAAESAHWVRLAAEQGNTDAQLALASMYGLGKGVPKDSVMAYAWLNVAAARDEKARELRDKSAEWMTAEKIAESQRLARELWARTEAARRAAPDPLTIQTPALSGSARELRATVQAARDRLAP